MGLFISCIGGRQTRKKWPQRLSPNDIIHIFTVCLQYRRMINADWYRIDSLPAMFIIKFFELETGITGLTIALSCNFCKTYFEKQ